jgi:membrane-bound lytic murein transglycosylase B
MLVEPLKELHVEGQRSKHKDKSLSERMTLTMTHVFVQKVKEGFVRSAATFALGSVSFALIPLQMATPAATIDTANAVWKTELVLADSTPELLVSTQRVPTIEKAPSAYQLEQERLERERLERERAAQEAQAKQIATAQASAKPLDASEDAKRELAAKAASAYGIPTDLLMAVWKIESGMQWKTQVKSSAGAAGPFQFMPGTWRGYAVDGNGDGVKDVHDAQDAAYGAAKLLAANGANRGDYRRALWAYNHADWYVNKVLAMAGM